MVEIIHKSLSDVIIDTAFSVQKELGVRFLEKIYENSLEIALIEKDFSVEKQKKIKVVFHNQIVGEYYADLVIEDKIILELKAVNEVSKIHQAQLINYLKATEHEVGYLINFGKIPLQFKRFVSKNNQ
jgi:GxxExxY protein